MKAALRFTAPLLLAAALAAAVALPAAAQAAASAGARSAGARGGAAVVLNPANLGLADAPRWSAHGPAASLRGTAFPVGMRALLSAGDDVAEAVRTGWLADIERAGGQAGIGRAEVTAFALSIGPVGVALRTVAAGEGWLPPGAARLGLFGNSDGPGAAERYTLAGTRFVSVAASTATLAWGGALPLRAARGVRVGVSASYHTGHFLMAATDNGSLVLEDPRWIHISVPTIRAGSPSPGARAGGGMSASLGVAWAGARLGLGAVLHDALSTFEWDADALVYQTLSVRIADDERSTDFSEHGPADAPEEVAAWAADLLRAQQLAPRLSVGARYRPDSATTLHADIDYRTASSLLRRRGAGLALGAERRIAGALAAQAGLATGPDGTVLTVGGAFTYGVLSLAAEAGRYHVGGGWGPVVGFSVVVQP